MSGPARPDPARPGGVNADAHPSRPADAAGRPHDHDHDHDHGRHGALPHAHGHGHAHAHALPDRLDRRFALGIGLNLAYVAVEAGFGWALDALALLADAAHNLGDVAGLLLAWAGVAAARRRPDARHSYGWVRAELLAAFVNGLLLVLAMGALAAEAVQRLLDPPSAGAGGGAWVMGVAAAGIAVNGATALLFLRGSRQDLNLRGAFLHMAGDAAVSLGVVLAAGLMLAGGPAWIDPLTGLLIAALIVAGSWGLLRDSLHGLMDGVPPDLDLDEVRALLRSLPGVQAVPDLHVWSLGSRQRALSAHLLMPAGVAGDEDDFLRTAGALLRDRFGIGHVTLQRQRSRLMPGCGEAAPGADGDDAGAGGGGGGGGGRAAGMGPAPAPPARPARPLHPGPRQDGPGDTGH